MRIVICDDHLLFLDALGSALSAHGHDVVAQVTGPAAAVQAVRDHRPDLLILDAHFPAGSGLEAVRAVRGDGPGTEILLLSASTDPEVVAAALQSGAVGFVRKDRGLGALLGALGRAAAGDLVVDADLFRAALTSRRERTHRDVPWLAKFLTSREREVLARIVAGESTNEMAVAMGVAPSTARTHVQNVLQKLGVHSRLQAATSVLGEPECRWLRREAGIGGGYGR
jgi:two-component system nitrate/nitrite response regulator NarL